MAAKDEKNQPQGEGAGEVLPFSDPVPDSVWRVAGSLASVETIVLDRAAEWKLFAESDTGKHGAREKALTKALIEGFKA